LKGEIMKIMDMVISAVIKKGILWEARNFETDVEFPENGMVVKIKAEHITARVEKDEK
jgi:hypothetical protein